MGRKWPFLCCAAELRPELGIYDGYSERVLAMMYKLLSKLGSSRSMRAFLAVSLPLLSWQAVSQAALPDVAVASSQSVSPVGTYRPVDFSWTDAERSRAVPARLYWPDIAKPGAQVPLVVFSHGLGGSRFGYSYLGRHWASLGIASLHVQHEGSDRAVWFGNIFKLVSNLQNAASEQNAVARAKDVSFAISQLLEDSEYAASVDRKNIAVAGHSYGANTAMLIGGATVLREGKPLTLRDERVKALVLISAPPFSGEGDMADILKPMTIPTLHVTGTEDIIRVPGYRSDLQDRLAVFDAQAFPRKMITVFKGATHSIFTDRIDRAGLELNEKVKRATRELSGLFLRAVLRGDSPSYMDEWAKNENALLERHTGAYALTR
jgi:pimeloyl-ACP methyl ester carboxylesterase